MDESCEDAPALCGLLDLDDLLLVHIASFLDVPSVLTLQLTCQRLAQLLNQPDVWRAKYLREFTSKAMMRATVALQEEDVRDWFQAYRFGYAIQNLRRVEWLKPAMKTPVQPCEGHAVCLFQDRYAVIVLGFGNMGLEPAVEILDLHQLPTRVSSLEVTETNERPHITYGHTLTPLPDGRLFLHGGCTLGGYFGAVQDGAVLSIDIQGDKATVKWDHVRLEGGVGFTSYHFVAPVPTDPSKLVVVGGLHDHDPATTVGLLETETFTWIPLVQAPDENRPADRYGFAAGIVDRSLWVLGGCSGSDIRRSGDDQRDVWALDLHVLLEQHQVQWERVVETEGMPENMFGRETAAVVVDKKILAIGGSINHMRNDEVTNALYWFDTETHTFNTVASHAQTRTMLPNPHLSGEAILYKHFFIAFGGWTPNGLLRGPYVANLAPLRGDGEDELPEAYPPATFSVEDAPPMRLPTLQHLHAFLLMVGRTPRTRARSADGGGHDDDDDDDDDDAAST
ncbi:hypothetical protein PTSG_05756 [Salpingoeca rosetta]|uniref:F-box domain-containing protein n=1 Tax=Salpingoeca rosetta (strain ATCC 50818 / BSB-021) TaxID=946362 RepID=F2UB51_SALR5|nr:uncharacterized protein PTSG_05756 [Salpingoeca rosetta]EGD74064.1 hypothetical protein PTSG_05756 [Salpingoeca rosetta]|eukprot:XP_004993626.1 hypothetical protein PTSG_05756 [Salpingoeca rosetta]